MKKNLVSVCLMVVVCLASIVFFMQGAYAVEIPKVPKDHPRVYIQKSDLPMLQKRIQEPRYQVLWQNIRKRESVLCRALVYLFEGDESAGRQAIEGALTDLFAPDVFPDTRHFDSAYHRAACVYDWCYPLLTEQEKTRFTNQFIDIAKQPNKFGRMYIGYPAQMSSNAATGHQNEGYLMASQLPAGVAIYDENKTMYDAAAKLFFERFVPVRNFFYPGHTHHQGTFYGVGRFHYDVNTTWSFKSLGAEQIWSREQQFVPYFYLYARRGDGVSFPVGDAIAGGRPTEVYAKVGSFYCDPYLLGQAPEQLGGDFGRLFDLLFRDYDTPTRDVSDLPLTRFFPSPGGAMVARSGWNIGPESRDAVVWMHMGEAWFGNHQHYDYGTFQISYRGPLTVSRGYYDSYGSEHMRNWYNSTISKNGLLIYDPNEKIMFSSHVVANDGGQTPQDENEHDNLPVTQMGRTMAHAFGPDVMQPDYSYLSGDVTKAYNKNKVAQVTRSMVAFNHKDKTWPMSFVVFDRVEATDASFKKTWLLHSIEEPNVVGRTIQIVRSGPNPGTRQAEMPAGAQFGGRLISQSLLPESCDIEKIGGDDKAFWVASAQKNFVPDIKPRKGLAFNPGAWRVEISAPTDAKRHLFLNAMTVMDEETTVGPEVSRVDAGDFVGARVHDRIVLFGKTGDPHSQLTVELPAGAETYGVLICDLKPGVYEVVQGDEVVATNLGATEPGQAIYFIVGPGHYQIRQISNDVPKDHTDDFWQALRTK